MKLECSLLNQARLQLDLLKKVLVANEDTLNLKNKFGKQSSTRNFKFDLMIAISNKRIIERPKNSSLKEEHKTDQIPEEILKFIQSCCGDHKNLFNVLGLYQLVEELLI